MRIKAIILDLDNTIYPVKAIGEKLFHPVFERIEKSGEFEGEFSDIKAKMMKQPFQKVADDFSFSEELKAQCLNLLPGLSYEGKMEPFDDYKAVRLLPCKKFLVTTGFSNMQYSKIKQLDLEKDFEKVVIVDPSQSELTKKDIFKQFLQDYHYNPEEVVVIGDDIESEIKFAKELGIETVLYNHNGEEPEEKDQRTITNFRELAPYLE